MGKQRDYWFDNAKFILIVAVILGHCLTRLGEGNSCEVANDAMVFFRMPLFIFMSGYFSKKMEWHRFWGIMLGVLETYLIMSVLHIGYNMLDGDKFSIMQIIEPRWTLWYLLCIVFWRLTIQLCAGHISSWGMLVISIVVGIISGFVPLYSVLSLQRAFSMAPFFMLGYYCRCEELDLRFIKRLHPSVVVVAIVSLCIFVSKVVFPYTLFFSGRFPYYYFDSYPLWLTPIIRLIGYVVSVAISICIMRLIPEKQSWISSEGMNTLFYYIYHPFLIIGLCFVDRYIELPSSLIAVLIYTLAIVFIIWVLIKIPFFRDLPRLFTKLYTMLHSRTCSKND